MGQAGGGAIADVLYGKVNPSGRLAETFPRKLADTPAHINFPGGNGEVRYGEGIFIGYRYYDAKEVPVQFPFGYGMSYTTFVYRNPKVSAITFRDVDGLTVSVDVTNTGKVTGKEVVQVYVHDHKSALVRPPKELKGFAKVELQPGETKTVTLALDFPDRGAPTRRLLDRLEHIAAAAGGRLYPAKDAVMSAASFHHGFPQAERFRAQIDPGMSSAFARRVELLREAA